MEKKTVFDTFLRELAGRGRSTFTKNEVMVQTGCSDEMLSSLFYPYKQDGIIQSVGSTGQRFRFNANKFLAAQRKRIRMDVRTYGLSPDIDISYYLTQPITAWEHDLSDIIHLSDWLRMHPNGAPAQTGQYRAQEIWGDEKYLLSGDGKTILRRVNVSFDTLCIEENPSLFEFFLLRDHKDDDRPCQHLIIENKTPVFDIVSVSDGCSYDTIIFGQGKRILGMDFSVFPKQIHAEKASNIFYYWGDIDREGIDIWYSLKERYPEVRLAIPFYQYSLTSFMEQQDGKHLASVSQKHGQRLRPEALSTFLVGFSSEEQAVIRSVIDAEQCIPQEILSRKELSKCLITISSPIRI